MLEWIKLTDLAISIGGFVGLACKMYALNESSTTWTRKSSLTNIIFYPPSLWAFWVEDLFITFTSTLLACLTWIGIYLYRSPPKEDWLGRK